MMGVMRPNIHMPTDCHSCARTDVWMEAVGVCRARELRAGDPGGCCACRPYHARGWVVFWPVKVEPKDRH